MGSFVPCWQFTLMTGNKNQDLEERQVPMSNKKKDNSTVKDISKRFDSFTKKTLKFLIFTELRSYIRKSMSGDIVYMAELNEVAAPEYTPDIEKIQVLLGDTQLFLKDEHLADGIKKLKKRHQKVLEYAIVLELPSEAIMEIMDLGAKSISNYKSEALRILRRHMEEGNGA